MPGYGDLATRIAPLLIPLVLVLYFYRHLRAVELGICLFGVLAAPLRMPDSLFADASLPEGVLNQQSRVLELGTERELSSRSYIVTLAGTDPVRLLCTINREWPKLEVGQRYFVWGRVLPYPEKSAPWAFDLAAYGRQHGAKGIIRIDSVLPALKSATPGSPDVRQWLGSRVDQLSAIPWQRELLRAFLLGEGRGVRPETRTKFNRAGLGHVLAVSGLHTGILFAILTLMLRPLRRWFPDPHLPELLALAPLSMYGWLTGGRPSVIRAILMCGAWVVARHSGRHTSVYAIWSLALFLSLLLSPSSLFNPGFQLSFSAVLAIIWGNGWLNSRLGNDSSKPVNRYLIWPAWFTLCAQAGTFPLSLYYFGLFPWLFLPANLVVLPALPFLIGLGMVGTALATTGLIFEEYVVLTEFLLSLLDQFLSVFQDPPDLLLTEYHMSLFEVGIAYAILLTVATAGKKHLWILLVVAAIGGGWKLHGRLQRLEVHRLWITHQYRGGQLWIQEGSVLFGALEDNIPDERGRAWMQREGLRYQPVLADRNVYDLNKGRYLVALDRTHWIIPAGLEAKVLWLRENSPVHLGQLLEGCRISQVVADDSNYTSAIDRWELSCQSYGIPFHRTDRDGPYTLDLTR